MSKEARAIAEQIKEMIDRLVGIAEGVTPAKTKSIKIKETSGPIKGAAGAVKALIDEGFLDGPKDLATILEKMKEIGHYHPRPAVSMNLLNLTKKRILNRLKGPETSNWQYVVRK